MAATQTKKATTKKATTKKATAKKTTAKKTTGKATTKQASAKTATTKKATAKTATTSRAAGSQATAETTTPAPRLLERDPQALLEDVGYAAAGVAQDAIALARALPGRVESLRDDVEKTAKDAPGKVKELRLGVPGRLETTVRDVRVRVAKDLQARVDSFEQRLDGKAAEGRKAAEGWRADDRVQRILEQTDNTRSQVKGAITSVIRTGSTAAEAGREQADTAGAKVKAAATSTRASAETITDAVADADTTDQ